MRAQIEVGGLAVEIPQTLHQGRRNDELDIGILVRIADEESWTVWYRRGHEIEVVSQPRQGFRHGFHHKRIRPPGGINRGEKRKACFSRRTGHIPYSDV